MVTFSTFLPVAALAAAAAPASASAYALFELLIAVAEAKLEAGEAHASTSSPRGNPVGGQPLEKIVFVTHQRQQEQPSGWVHSQQIVDRRCQSASSGGAVHTSSGCSSIPPNP